MPFSPRVVLVVPCYNEAARLRPDAILSFLRERPHVRLHFVDDGSRDRTFSAIEALEQAEGAQVSHRRLSRNHGKAEAVRQGILDAWETGVEFVGFWDADLSTPLQAVDDFLRVAECRPHLEVLLGSRVMLMGRDIRRRPLRHYLGRVFATGASLALDLPVYDTQCGAKLFRTNPDLRQVFGRPFRSPWIFDVEILARYLRVPTAPGTPPRRDRIYELAVPAWYDVPGSKLRMTDYSRALRDLLAVWRERRRRA